MAKDRDLTRDNSTQYRPCVGIALFNARGEVFVGRRRQDPGPAVRPSSSLDGTIDEAGPFAWQMPQGGIDAGETPLDAALRELYEETNVASVALLDEAPDWLTYDLPAASGGQSWKGRYRGQTQRWFAFRFTGADSEIDVLRPGGGRHKAEFMDWRWVALSETPDLIIPFKRPVYEAVARIFAAYGTPR